MTTLLFVVKIANVAGVFILLNLKNDIEIIATSTLEQIKRDMLF